MRNVRGNKTIIEYVKGAKSHFEYRVGKNATLTLVFIISKDHSHDIRALVHLKGFGATATIIGFYRSKGDAQVHLHTLQHHAAANTTSNLLVKSVLRDTSTFSYEGSILVDRPAQKTDAYQRNENLLLDGSAKATSKPALEILANDVRCTHGATVGTVEPNHLWYLATRGIDKTKARSMIADGFLKSALALVPDTIKRDVIEKRLNNYLYG